MCCLTICGCCAGVLVKLEDFYTGSLPVALSAVFSPEGKLQRLLLRKTFRTVWKKSFQYELYNEIIIYGHRQHGNVFLSQLM